MPDSPTTTRSSSPAGRWWCGGVAVAILLALHFILGISAVWNKSNTFDEIIHIGGGYSYWRTGDYRPNAESGILAQRIAAAPLLFLNVKFQSSESDTWSLSNCGEIGERFFYKSGNNPKSILLLSRCVMALVGVALGLAIYLYSRKLFGPEGGILSLALYAFCPAFLANGPLATTDVTVSLFFLLSVMCYWSLLQKVSPLTVLATAAAVAGLFLSKMSGIGVLPMLLALLIVRLAVPRPLTLVLRKPVQIDSRLRQALLLTGATALVFAVVVVLIWGAYGFRYSALNASQQGQPQLLFPWDGLLKDPDVQAVSGPVAFAREHRLLPEPYLFGFTVMFVNASARPAFMNGHYSMTGWPSFFPYCLAVKTPIAIFLVLLLAAAAAARRSLSEKSARAVSLLRVVGGSLYPTAPLWVLLAVYWGFAVASHLNLGHRYILPTYAPMLILAGAAGAWLAPKFRAMRLVVAAIVIALVVETVAVWPNYLAYFNVFAGGPSNGYKHLVDSSCDWGQDLPGLKQWLDEHLPSEPQGTKVYLSYFGTASPAWYRINAVRLTRTFDVDRQTPPLQFPLEPGIFCVSATEVERLYPPFAGPWVDAYEQAYQKARQQVDEFSNAGPEGRSELIRTRGDRYWKNAFANFRDMFVARFCSFLRHRESDDNVGHSILIYRLNQSDLDAIQYGPPAELLPDSENPFL